MLFAVVRRGKQAGMRRVPHRYKEDGRFHVTLGRRDSYIPLADERDIPDYLANGYSLIMSSDAERYSPKVIRPVSIRGWK